MKNIIMDMIKSIFSSATKLVLLMVSLTACVAFMMGVLKEESFYSIAMMVLGFYFGRTTTNAQTDLSDITNNVQDRQKKSNNEA